MKAKRILVTFIVALAIASAAVVIVGHSSTDTTAKPGDVNETRIMADAATGNNWLVNGRTNDSKHFSPLKQINDQNVASLGLAWYLDYDGLMGVVSEPIVVDGVIYISAPLSKIYAVQASTGKVLWKYDPQIRLDQALNGSYSARTNGGVAVWNGKVYVGTGDCRLIAIDAATAKKIWEASVCEPLQTGITGAPRVLREKSSWATTARMTPSAALLPPTTQRLARNSGASGPFLAIPRKVSKPKNWKWPRKPGPAKAPGKSAAATYGTPSPMTTPPAS